MSRPKTRSRASASSTFTTRSAVSTGATCPRDGAAITAAAINGRCAAAAEAVDLFCHFLGVVAGNLALTLGAFGGIYITGGIIPQWGEHFAASRFRQSFAAKGVYSDYVARIPTWLVLHPYPAFEGLKRLLERA